MIISDGTNLSILPCSVDVRLSMASSFWLNHERERARRAKGGLRKRERERFIHASPKYVYYLPSLIFFQRLLRVQNNEKKNNNNNKGSLREQTSCRTQRTECATAANSRRVRTVQDQTYTLGRTGVTPTAEVPHHAATEIISKLRPLGYHACIKTQPRDNNQPYLCGQTDLAG